MLVNLHPRPPEFGDADWRNVDTFGIDCTLNMATRGDTIVSVALVAVTRDDLKAITGADYTVSNLAVVPGGTVINGVGGPWIALAGCWVAWTGTGGVAAMGYLITVAITLASGAVLNVTAHLTTPSFVG